MFKFALFLVINTIIVQTKGHLDEYCWATDTVRSQIKTSFASKTPYQPNKGDPSRYNKIPNCTPKKIWLFTRHGTRLPHTTNIKRMKLFAKIRDSVVHHYKTGNFPIVGGLCQQDIELINNWKWNSNISSKYDEYLVDQGWDDLEKLAKSYKMAYPHLIPSKYSSKKFFFRFTNTQRTKASFKAFVTGLFGSNSWVNIPFPPVALPDYLLRHQNTCPAWYKHFRSQKSSRNEPYKFRDSLRYRNLIREVSARLGFMDKRLRGRQIRTLYDLCRFEQSWYLNQTSAWCAAFTKKQLKILNYEHDIKTYYKVGHGSKINENLACELVSDLIKRLDAYDDQNTFYFSHSTTLYLFLVALRVRVDIAPLTSSAFDQLDDRKWKTSELCPFASNLAFVKYHCPLKSDTEQVLVLLNERPMEIDWCKNGLCSWSEFKKQYKHITQGDCRKHYCKNFKYY